MKFIKFKEKTIGFNSIGRGKNAIVFLHGFCEDSCLWDDFKKDLLAENKRVITIDLPGFGTSAVVKDLSIDYMADVVKAVIQNQKIKKIILIGHSMGGYVSLAFAEKYPELLFGLGLFHSHGFADNPATIENRKKSIDFIKRQGHALYLKQIIPTFFAPKFASANPYQLDKLMHKASGYDMQGIIEGQKAMMSRPNRIAILKEINIPVLILIGQQDVFITAEQAIEQAQYPKTCFVHLLPKVGHMGMFEAPHETQVHVRKFVEFCELEQEYKSES